jgi:hypothetical protein
VPRSRSSSSVELPAGSAAGRAGSGEPRGVPEVGVVGGRGGGRGRATRALLRRRRCRRGFGVSWGEMANEGEMKRRGRQRDGGEEPRGGEVVGAPALIRQRRRKKQKDLFSLFLFFMPL